jgi:hypothetical protein
MNILELDSYNLDDAVKFNDRLNPRLWDSTEHLRPEVRAQLLRIADDFREFLGVTDLDLQDITVSGSNAAYTYTPNSDIDLHLVVKMPDNEVYRELFDAKKFQYNEQHNITIGGYDVELYVQDADQPHISQGIYSVLNDDWIQVPRRVKSVVDDTSTENKFKTIGLQIERAIKSGSLQRMTRMAEKIKKMRQTGLESHGEFGPENLAFKMLRSQGKIKQLYDARNAAKDQELSLDERRKAKKKKRVKYGFGGYWYPGTAYAGQDHPAGTEGGDGGGDGGGESIKEDAAVSDEDILKDFVKFCVAELKIESMPTVKLRRDPQWSVVNRTFGRYINDAHLLEVAFGQRHIMDVLRTVAHELTHTHQHEREAVPDNAGETGSSYENEANARAGILMRDYGQLHPELFDAGETALEEGASGYIPTKAQAKDPRFSMALTVDIKPGQIGKEANKLKLKTDRQGAPQLARPNGLFEELMLEFQLAKEGIDAPISKTKDDEQYYRFILGKARLGRPLTRAEQDYVKMYQMYRQQKLAEFAPGAQRDDRGPDEEEILRQYAAQWYNGDEDPRVEKLLATMGWEIGQNEDEAGGAFVIRRGDINGDSFISWSDAELSALNEISDELRRSYLGRAGQQVDRRMEKMAQVRDRLNKGYEIYHAEDPTFIVHRFEANTPAEARRYYETFIDRYESDRDFDLQLRRSTGLMEAFNAPYPMTWEHSKDSHDALVKLPDGTNLSIMFSKEYMFGDEEDWHVEFWRNNSQEVTGEGDAQRVFATVLNAIQQFIKTENPERIRFSASKDQEADSRTNLYGSLVRRYANAWGYEVDSSEYGGSTVFNFYKLHEQDLNEDEELDEVKMSPGALEKFATSDAAKGIRAGFEAELIFRDTQGSSDDIDPEPDYDADERAYSISQVIEFFDNDEYGYGLSDRERNRLEENLDESYMQWRDEQIISDFRNDAEDLIREKLLDETPLSERIHLYLTDSEQMSDKEADRIIAAGVDAPKFDTSKEQQAYAAQNPYYQAYLDALDAAELELDESVEYSVSQQDGYWDEALDDYRDDYSGDDDSFFSDVGLRWMSDIANEFGLDWPVWNMDSGRNNGSRSWEDIGSELQALVDMPVVVSDNYHSTSRRPGQWIIEPDGSLHADDQSEEAGLEIVSPPMPLLTAIEKLRQVTDWANDPRGGNAYTNGTTGLHMGVSLPTMKSEDATDDTGIDYVKLILFMGDKYVQQQFGREANNFCASALDKFRQNIKGKRSDPAGVVELLRHGLTELAYRELQKGVGTSKYTSAHIQPGYIEFRSPGGDWLAKSDEEIGILENTMLRFARAMAIAGDPSAERQEYAKKLYKLVTQDNPQYADQLKLFSEFSAGTINKEQLKKQWADSVLQKEIPTTGQEEYEVYDMNKSRSPEGVIDTFYARNYDDANDQYTKKYVNDPRWTQTDIRLKQPWFDVFDDTGKVVATMRARDGDTAQDRAQYEFGQQWTDAWRVYRRPDESPEPEKKLSPRAQVAKRITTKKIDFNYDIVSRNSNKVIDRFYAQTPQEAEQTYSAWLKQNSLPDDSEDYGYRKTEQAADNQRDSADIQRRLGIQDIDTDVAQNFAPDLSAYERNSDRIDAIRAQQGQAQDATQRSGSWSIYDVTLGREITRMDNVPWQQANDRADELERSTGHNMSVRGLSEAVDAVSGTGAIARAIAGAKPPSPVPVRRKDPAVKLDIRNRLSDPYAQTYKKPVEENFADGKGPGRPGDSQRHGIPKGATMAELEKASHAKGRKGQLARWQLNMRRGKKK